MRDLPDWFRRLTGSTSCMLDRQCFPLKSYRFMYWEDLTAAVTPCQGNHQYVILGLNSPVPGNSQSESRAVYQARKRSLERELGPQCSGCKADNRFEIVDFHSKETQVLYTDEWVWMGQGIMREGCRNCNLVRGQPLLWFFRDPVSYAGEYPVTLNHTIDAYEILKSYSGNINGLFGRSRNLPVVVPKDKAG